MHEEQVQTQAAPDKALNPKRRSHDRQHWDDELKRYVDFATPAERLIDPASRAEPWGASREVAMANDFEVERAARVAAVARPRPEAMAAAKWWVDQLRGGEQGSAGDAMIDFMWSMLPRDALTARELNTLEAELAAGVEAEIAMREEWYRDCPNASDRLGWHLSLGVDYGPDRVLAAAVDRAAVAVKWPIKTDCTVMYGRLEARCGYRGKSDVVWLSEEGARHWARVALERCRDELAAINAAVIDGGLSARHNVSCALDHVRLGLVWLGGS